MDKTNERKILSRKISWRENLLPIRTQENSSLIFLLHAWINYTSQSQLLLCVPLASIPHWQVRRFTIFLCNPFLFFFILCNQTHSQICFLKS
jgi:hypothetical protein